MKKPAAPSHCPYCNARGTVAVITRDYVFGRRDSNLLVRDCPMLSCSNCGGTAFQARVLAWIDAATDEPEFYFEAAFVFAVTYGQNKRREADPVWLALKKAGVLRPTKKTKKRAAK